MPVFDQPFVLHTDYQGDSIAAILEQTGADHKSHIIAYASKTCAVHEAKLGSTDGELLAVIFGIERFHNCLAGTLFTLVTDHEALMHLNSARNTNSKFARYALRLAPYDFRVRHRKGSTHKNADKLSRSFMEVDTQGAL